MCEAYFCAAVFTAERLITFSNSSSYFIPEADFPAAACWIEAKADDVPYSERPSVPPLEMDKIPSMS